MKGLIVAVAALLVICGNAIANDAFEHCILDNMKGVKSDEAANSIRSACRSLHSKWETDRTATYSSNATKNNHNKKYSVCDDNSPDGKYCADVVSIVAKLSDTSDYEYRFKEYSGNCPKIHVTSGPRGWMEVLSCSFTEDGKRFEAKIKGWTHPQVFSAKLTVEKRRR